MSDDIPALIARLRNAASTSAARDFYFEVAEALEAKHARAEDAHKLLAENAETMDQQEEWLEQAQARIAALEAALSIAIEIFDSQELKSVMAVAQIHCAPYAGKTFPIDDVRAVLEKAE